MIPFCDFGMGKDSVVTAGDAGRETTGYVMVGGVVSLSVPCRIVFVLPVAVLCYMNLSWNCPVCRIVLGDSRSLNVYHMGTYLSYRLMTKVA
jgi:hypothetical protein